ncbi:G-protein coupled receptor 171 isoform X2 [Passer domesticus]|uniref:G-protein coupled receptor 171 isoform X2 n=1 Tax=Passer domesticus TaxID=48849 RepID=UPI0030FE0187
MNGHPKSSCQTLQRSVIPPVSKANSHKEFTMSSNFSECHLHEEMEPFTYFYYLIFLMGIIGSCFALWAFTQKDQKQKCMSIYLINLLTADFLLTLTLPVKIIVDLGIASWNLRIFHCQVTACFIYLNMYLSIIFLGFVSMDRCLQLMHSSKVYRIQEPGFAKTLSAVVWVMLLLITVPNMAIPTKHIEEQPGVGCIDFKTKFGRDWHVFTNFICTAIFLNSSAAILVSNCLLVRQLRRHGRGERGGRVRAALAHVLLVTAAYLLCFVPYHAVRIPYTLSQGSASASCPLRRALFKAKESTLLFAIANLCLDPVLYYHLSKSFRLKFTEAFAAPKEATALRAAEEAQQQSCSLPGDTSRACPPAAPAALRDCSTADSAPAEP